MRIIFHHRATKITYDVRNSKWLGRMLAVPKDHLSLNKEDDYSDVQPCHDLAHGCVAIVVDTVGDAAADVAEDVVSDAVDDGAEG